MPKQKAIELALAKPMELKPDGKLPKNFLKAKFIYAEPKLDGFRGIAIVRNGYVKLYTSGGVRVVNGPKIQEALLHAARLDTRFDNRVYDGEFFTKNWNDTGSIVKTLTPDHPHRNKLAFRIFDTLTYSDWKTRKTSEWLIARKLVLSDLLSNKNLRINKSISVIGGIEITCPPNEKRLRESMDEFFRDCVKAGHEGAVFKLPISLYSFKKSKDWLKMKPFTESDLKIVDAKEGTGRNKGRLGAFICVGKIDGKKVKTKVGGGLTDALRDKFWAMHKKKKLIGKIIEVTHEGLTSNNAVRFPRFSRERWDKSKPN